YPQGGRPHHAVFVLKEPLTHPGGSTLTFTLRQTHGGGHLIGRLRLSVTTAASPGDGAVLPQPVAGALAVAPAAPTHPRRAHLAPHYLAQKLARDLAALPPLRLVYCATSTFAPDGTSRPAGKPRPVHVLKRGEIRRPGAVAGPGTLSLLPGLGGRFRLA